MIQTAIDWVRAGSVKVKFLGEKEDGIKMVQVTSEEGEIIELSASDVAIVFLCVATGHNIHIDINFGTPLGA